MSWSGARAPVWAALLFCALVMAAAAQAAARAGAEGEGSTAMWKTEPQTDEQPPDWVVDASFYVYFTPDGSYPQPTLTVNHHSLHLEARYNYEAQRTASTWVGRDFSFGENVTFQITPMLGGAFGDTNGLLVGLEGTVTWSWLELYSEGEYLFSPSDRAKSFIYGWSTLTVSPTEWFRLGVVVQRTRAYATSLELQRGFLVGLTTKHVGVTALVFNPDLHTPTYVFALELTW